MISIKDYIVQHLEADDSMLHNKLLNVNMRLFNSNKGYQLLILGIIDYMEAIAEIDFTDYAAVKGISGANVGIPFNIIGIKDKDKWDFFLNPRYLNTSTDKVTVKSNCGSFGLKEAVKVERYDWVELKYYDTGGEERQVVFKGPYGFTIQHEVNHNNGITIID